MDAGSDVNKTCIYSLGVMQNECIQCIYEQIFHKCFDICLQAVL